MRTFGESSIAAGFSLSTCSMVRKWKNDLSAASFRATVVDEYVSERRCMMYSLTSSRVTWAQVISGFFCRRCAAIWFRSFWYADSVFCAYPFSTVINLRND